ncbi:MAG: hypothetical protein V2A56_07205 [bacterium]
MGSAKRHQGFIPSGRVFGARIALFLLVFAFPLTAAYANRLVSASVGTREKNTSLLVLKFDVPTQLSVSGREGRSIILSGDAVDRGPDAFHPSGLIRDLRVDNGNVVITATRYVSARLTNAGAGIYLIILEPAKEPPATRGESVKPVQTRQSAAPASQPVSKQPRSKPESTPDKPLEREPEVSKPLQATQQKTTPNPSQTQVFRMDQPVTSQEQAQNRQSLADLYEWIPVQPIVLPTTVQFALELSQQGNRDRAILLLESIKPNEPEFGWSRIALGRMVEQTGDFNKALDYYRQALEDRETEGVAAVRIALAFQAVGNPNAAVALWERVLDMNQGQVYVDPSEMPIPRAEPSSFVMQTPIQPLVMEQQPRKMDKIDTSAVDSSGNQLASGAPRKGSKSAENPFSFLRFWPFAIGLILFLALLYFGLKWLHGRSGGPEYDINQDVANLGLDLDAEADLTTEPVAGQRVANMYAEQSTKTDGEQGEELSLDDDSDRQAETNDVHLNEEEFNLSEDKVAKVREMHTQGSTVREIAEELGLGQDEVRMAIRLAEAEQ